MKLQTLRKMLDTKEISAVELTQDYIAKIKSTDKLINSYITVCEEEALLSAKKAQSIIDSNNSAALTGIPISVKDNICTKGIKTTCASRMLKDFVPFYNAAVIDKVLSQNAVILGKTNMDEFAMGSSSQTSYFGGVKNPHDTSKIPGGSSGGAAASVASELCSVALGSDTGGSIIQPSAFCGVTGLKPTYGTVSRFGLIAFASSLEQIGVIANSAADAAYMLDCIYGQDTKDSTTSPLARGNYLAKINSDIKGTKIGLPKEFYDVSPEVKNAVLQGAKYFENLGCEIIECSLPSLEYAVAAYYLISSAEASSNLSRFDGIKYGYKANVNDSLNSLISYSRSEGFGKEVKRRIMLGNYALSSGYYDEYYKKASKIRMCIKAEYDEIFKSCDVILTPSAPTAAYDIDSKNSSVTKMYSDDICTVPPNLAGLPVITTTCGYDENMPIGMSLVGKAFDEQTIIALCDRFEQDFKRQEVYVR